LPVTDAAVLSQHVGGVVLVVGSHKLKQQDLQKSLNALAMVGSNLLGVVMNMLPAKGPDAYAYSYYSHDGPASSSDGGLAKSDAREFRSTHASTDEFEASLTDVPSRPARAFPSARIRR
jgi:Mrp family chromosome partitioning ATPase